MPKNINEIQILKNSPGWGYLNIEFDCEPDEVLTEDAGLTGRPIFSSDLMDAGQLRSLRVKLEAAIESIDWCLQEKDGTPI